MYFDFEIDRLLASLGYPNKLFYSDDGKSKKDLEERYQPPRVMQYRKPAKWVNPATGQSVAVTEYNLGSSYISEQISILKFIDYSVDMELIASSFLKSLCQYLKNYEAEYSSKVVGRGAILAIVENYRSQLLNLLDNWNLKFFKTIKTKIPNEDKVKGIVKDYIHGRIDASLLNLRLAKKFFDCYALVKNYDKGFLLLTRAFKQNKWAVDIFVNAYIKYYREKPLMHHFLRPEELNFPDVSKWQWRSMYEWITTLETLDKRNPHMKSLLDYLGDFLSIDQIMDILETLAINADKTSNFYESERYYENLLYIYDNVKKLELIEKHFSKTALPTPGTLVSPRRAGLYCPCGIDP